MLGSSYIVYVFDKKHIHINHDFACAILDRIEVMYVEEMNA